MRDYAQAEEDGRDIFSAGCAYPAEEKISRSAATKVTVTSVTAVWYERQMVWRFRHSTSGQERLLFALQGLPVIHDLIDEHGYAQYEKNPPAHWHLFRRLLWYLLCACIVQPLGPLW